MTTTETIFSKTKPMIRVLFLGDAALASNQEKAVICPSEQIAQLGQAIKTGCAVGYIKDLTSAEMMAVKSKTRLLNSSYFVVLPDDEISSLDDEDLYLVFVSVGEKSSEFRVIANV